MNRPDKEIDELMTARPFRTRQFNERLQDKVLADINAPKRSVFRAALLVPIAICFVVLAGAGVYFLQGPGSGRTPASPPPSVEQTPETDPPATANDGHLTLAELAGKFRLYADAADETADGYSQLYVENLSSGQTKAFDWPLRIRITDSSLPATMQLADLNQDASDELVIILGQTNDDGRRVSQPHVLDPERLMEWEIQDPADYLEQNTESQISYINGYAFIELKTNGLTYRKAIESTTTEPWDERIDFRYAIAYEVADNPTRLMAHIAAAAGAGAEKLHFGDMDLSYTTAGNGLTVEAAGFQPNSEVAGEIPLYGILTSQGSFLKLNDWDNEVDLAGLLGNPLSEKTEQLGEAADTLSGSFIKKLTYDGMTLELFSPKDNGKTFWLMNMQITADRYATSLGIRVGDTVQALKEAYPPIQIAKDGRSDPNNAAYELNDEQYRRLRFEVANGIVTEVNIQYLIP